MNSNKNRYRIETVHQAGQVLKLVANSRTPMGSAEIGKALGMTANAAFRMCATLEEVGFLKEAGGKYELAWVWRCSGRGRKAGLKVSATA